MLEQNQRQRGNQDTVGDILGLIDRVEENLDRSLEVEREAERERESDYAELKARIDSLVLYVQKQLVELDAQIATLGARVAAAKDKCDVAEQAASDWTVRFTDRKGECVADATGWQSFFNNISAELATCGKVMYLLEDKRALLARYGL